jgi:hypothetical protein
VVIWYIFFRFGILYQEKSGNPAWHHQKLTRTKGLKAKLSLAQFTVKFAVKYGNA